MTGWGIARTEPRLKRLYELRDRLDAEIAAEEAGLVRHAQTVRRAFPPPPKEDPYFAAGHVIRAWARANGHPVSPRGKIAHSLRAVYAQAMEEQ